MSNEKRQSKILSVLLWSTQIILSLSLIGGAFIKFLLSPEELAKMFPWTAENRGLLMTTAIIDFLLGVGLILPNIVHPKSKLTILSAYGLVILMSGASIFHINRGESADIGINIFFLLLAVFIIWGRQKQLKS
ncbi:DoxX family protein [Fulvivirgaceae bacterium LMO-SS25]